MKKVLAKVGSLLLTLVLVSMVTFFLFQVIPGDSALSKAGMNGTTEQVELLKEQYGLNKPILERYVDWLAGVLKGDFGISYNYNMPVKQLIGERMGVTLGLGIMSMILILVFSIPLGLLASRYAGKWIDKVIMVLNQVIMAIPHFFLGMLISLIFGLTLKWFMPGRYISYKQDFWGFVGYMIYPAIAIALPKIAMLVKFLRTSVNGQMHLDYVRTARSKGASERYVLYHHVLKNALIAVITFFAMIVAEVMAGSIILETVFSLPGLGRLLVVSISNRDFPVVQAIILYIAIIVIVMNAIVDILYRYIDPRVQNEM